MFRRLFLLGMSFAIGGASAYDRATITFGCVVRLKHRETGKYLTATNEKYVHKRSSTQPAVYGQPDGNLPAAHWIIKGAHSGDRWNYSMENRDKRFCSMIGWPVRRDQFLRLENIEVKRNLHSHHHPSPATGQQEVTNYGNNQAVGDTNDNFQVEDNDTTSGWMYLASGYPIKLKHVNTNHALHSHRHDWQQGKQEVTGYRKRDNNDWWIIELVKQPKDNEAIKPLFEQTRSTKLSYWSPLFWDSEVDDCSYNFAGRRVWAHGGSRHDRESKNKPPHDHMELLLGPWEDARARRGPSLFVMHSADNKFKTGPISFGDKVKMMAVFGGPGAQDKAGFLVPFRYLWVNEFSRWNKPHREIVITRPDHSQTQDDGAVFILEPIIDGQTGEISTLDLVRIKNVKTGAYLWTYRDSVHGDRWWEILVDKDNEDVWGKKHHGVERRISNEKYRFSLAQKQTAADDVAKGNLDVVNNEIAKILGAEASKHEAINLKAEKEQLAQQKALADQQLAASKAETERLKAESTKQLEDLKKSQEEALANAKAEAEAMLEKAKNEDKKAQVAAKEAADKLLAETKAALEAQKKDLQDQLEKEKEEARQMLQEAKEALDEAKKEAEANTKKKIDEVQAQAEAELEKAALQAAELERMIAFPTGFVRMPGKAKGIAFGLQDFEIEKVVDNKGTKAKERTFDDFGVLILQDGSLAQYKVGASLTNPWLQIDVEDDKGSDIKVATAAVGTDGTTFIVSLDGKSLYGINWPGDKLAIMPNPALGFALAAQKEEA
ncbi:hypothetical protein FJ364_04580, partial [Candidatus Dependentiae bacterium]|nr:hypothetical protein [Candidatus Dependentiae bacterium]